MSHPSIPARLKTVLCSLTYRRFFGRMIFQSCDWLSEALSFINYYSADMLFSATYICKKYTLAYEHKSSHHIQGNTIFQFHFQRIVLFRCFQYCSDYQSCSCRTWFCSVYPDGLILGTGSYRIRNSTCIFLQ